MVIIDEAHRSVYQKYGAIFDYFDSLLVGLTATPKDEIDRNTYRLFSLEQGIPTDAYALDDAVNDGFLVPARAVAVPLKFQREGIKYADLSDEEQEQWDALEWDEEGHAPDHVEAAAVNRWLFNEDTVDKVLAHLMTRGQSVAGGDRLGKTIIFAKNNDHAQFIADRFNQNYPHYKGEFGRVITFKTEYAQSLIDSFANPAKSPHIAISVDMLDTGIDIPEVVNLVFFKLVRSKTKFWQMVGRGTRLCPDLFGPGQHKEFFYLFDYCQNLEFFSQKIPTTDGTLGTSLGARLFKARVELIVSLDQRLAEVGIGPFATAGSVVREVGPAYGETDQGVRDDTATLLRSQVASMNLDNFIVRPKRRLVERYALEESWKKLGEEQVGELVRDVASLPTELADDDEEAKRFDLLMLNLQLAVLHVQPGFERLKEQVRSIVGMLEDKSSIPMVREQMPLIDALASEEWWQDVTVPMLETARKRLRLLIKLIEKVHRKPVYTDFEDQMGSETAVPLPEFTNVADRTKFVAKARQFLKANENHITIARLRLNQPLTSSDLAELERMMVDAGVGTADEIAREVKNKGLGVFIRSLVGLDRAAAKQAFSQFLSGGTTTANQVEFVNLIVDHLTENGVMDPKRLWESPFTDRSPQGPEGLFSSGQVDQLVEVLAEIRKRAVA